MPIRKRQGSRQHQLIVDSGLFHFGDATWSFFPSEPVYPNRLIAARAWRQCRREVWTRSNRFTLPEAAVAFDGLSNQGWERLWTTWQRGPYQLEAVLEGLERDRAAVAAFRRRESRAVTIADYLDRWLEDLQIVEFEARRIASEWTAGRWPSRPEITSADTYGTKAAQRQ
jgi:hypothetical protein